MLTTFYKAAWRSLFRNKVFSLLNILGLAIGMTACFFIFQYARFERSYDSFNSNANNVYRVPLEYLENAGSDYIEATNYPATGPAMKANFPEVISFARLVPASVMLATATVSRIEGGVTRFSNNEKRVFFADPAILRMFTVPMVRGNDTTALRQIRAIVLSESAAKKYFGSENPMNKTLFLNGSFAVTVAGVFKDMPENSHLKFDMLISFPDEKFQSENWSWSAYYTYVMLSPGTDPKSLEDKFPAFIDRYLGSKARLHNFKNRIFLQQIKDIHLNSRFRKELEPNGSKTDVWFLSILSFFVLLIAYINYINLSTAKVMERAGEIGLRKVIGASRFQLVRQFLVESLLVNCLALMLAGFMIACLVPFYEDLIGKSVSGWFWSSGLLVDKGFWMSLSLMVVGGSFIIGIYPALLMSKYNPVHVLKGKFYGSHNGIVVRKALSAFQFFLAIILIAGSLIVFDQLNYMRNESLGYDKTHIVVVKTPGLYDLEEFPKIDQLQRQLLEGTSINDVGLSTEIPGESINRKTSTRVFGQGLNQNVNTSVSQIDDHFLNTYHLQLLAGRNFSPQDSVDISPIDGVSYPAKVPVIANESFIKNSGFKSGEDALNKLITISVDEHELKAEIIGVIGNYHQTSLKDPYQPTLYVFPSRAEWKYISLNINTNNLNQTVSFIGTAYKNLFAANPFEFFFQDDYFNEQYKSDQRFARIFNVFTALTIFVSCLGLLGLLSFIIRIRTKEIGIRRVLGASVYGIMVLFFKDFLKLIVVAALFALPAIYFFGNEWLNNFAFHAPLHLFVFILPPLVLMVITFISVTTQSLKTILSNAVTLIRDE